MTAADPLPGRQSPPTVLALGGSILISGSTAIRAAAWAILVAKKERRRSGLPHLRALDEIGNALVAAIGHVDVHDPAPEAPYEQPDVSIEEAAQMLTLSRRQTCRLAKELGGKIVAGRWMLDRQAILERKDHRATHHPI